MRTVVLDVNLSFICYGKKLVDSKCKVAILLANAKQRLHLDYSI